MGKSKNKKGKRKKQGTQAVQENLLPPVLTKEVEVELSLPKPDVDSDVDSSPPPSPTESVCSTTSSLLSIGPPPYVQPVKSVGKLKSPVASLSKYHESFESIAAGGLQPKKKSHVSKVDVKEEPTPSTSTGGHRPVVLNESSQPDVTIDSPSTDLPISRPKVGPAKKKVREDVDLPRTKSPKPGPSKETEVPVVDLTNGSPTNVPVIDLTLGSSSGSGDTTNELLSVIEIDDDSEGEESVEGSSELGMEPMSPESIFGSNLDSPGFAEIDELPDTSALGDVDFLSMTDDLISTAITSSSSGDDSEILEYMLMQYDLADFPAISRCIDAAEKELVAVPSDCNSDQIPTEESDIEPTSAGIENLEHLQTELESLCSSLITRINILNGDREQICQPNGSRSGHVNACATAGMASSETGVHSEPVAGPSSAIAGPPPAAAVASQSFEKPSKTRCQPTRGRGPSHQRKVNDNSSGSGRRNSSASSVPKKDSQQFTYSDFETMSDNFWKFVDFYVPTVKQEDLDRLDRLIVEHENIPDNVLRIPPLGKHFKDTNSTGVKTRQHTQQAGPTKDSVGPLTERLVKTLVDERVATYKNTRARTKAASLATAGQAQEPNHLIEQQQNLAKDLGLDGSGSEGNQGQPLEEKLRNSMPKYKLLFSINGAKGDAAASNDPQDAVLTEIHRTQAELKRLHAHNAQIFANLRARAVKELELNDLRDQLTMADQRVYNIYRAQQLRPSKKLPVKLKNEAIDALRNRSNLIKLIDGKLSEGPQANVNVAFMPPEDQPQPSASKETGDAP